MLACGVCADVSLGSYVPFVWYWLVLFVGWAALWCPAATVLEASLGQPSRLLPAEGMLLWVPLFGVGWLLAGASLIVPGAILCPAWLLRLHRAVPSPSAAHLLPRAEASVRRILLTASALAVPMGYVRFHFQRSEVPHWLVGGPTLTLFGS